jgi:hypothetical protein
MKDKIWEIEFGGRQIRVINRFSIFPPRHGEYLEVDGQLVAKGNGGLLSEFAIIVAQVDFAGVERQVEVRIAEVKRRFCRVGCHILIDGQLVGGDTSEILLLPELDHARQSHREHPRQFFHKFIIRHFIGEGFPLALLISLISKPHSLLEGLVLFSVTMCLAGSFFAWMTWRSLKPALKP